MTSIGQKISHCCKLVSKDASCLEMCTLFDHLQVKYRVNIGLRSKSASSSALARCCCCLLGQQPQGFLQLVHAEVTVELEDKAPFWATVVDTKEDMKKKTEDGNCVYTVEDENGNLPPSQPD